MARILVLYYSSYGHTATMAEAVAEGVRNAGHECDVRHVPETAPEEVVKSAGFTTMDGHSCIEGPDKLTEYDGIVVGSPTRYGRMSSQMASFWDQTGGLWMKGALIGKVGAAFTSTASQHGGQETTLFSILTNLLHMGCTVVGLDYGFQDQMGVDEVKGGAPYGATTIAGGDGSRQPSKAELDGARYLGRRVAETAAKLHA
ncbi:NAD(P)H:quinone oxidoreductase [Aurantiacibacter poecillastricola]|uniref:NAD(P)H:quinone oxidoreductase n=1 Tax=Aurantiacibacter poecillastricola TaxID=3064385 RepID=UPI00273DAFF6|nr:NAD(P)H:quinone oxidoreductase [Aurantiacibacter sp. 219JJ12-13]MDP5262491.1 NAD(P)H:quinone oxidoreductase [Aurantiacibacter sp. 219JJ12-13]